MDPDYQICYCYHVSLRKLVNFARREQPDRASQLSQCLGAGTGCGWCIPILKRIHEACEGCPGASADSPEAFEVVSMSPEQYAAARDEYRKSGQPKNAF